MSDPQPSFPARLLGRMQLAALGALRYLASDTACRLGGALGVLAWRLGIRRRLVAENLHRALRLTGPARALAARRAYATVGANFVETWTAGGVDGIEHHAVPANPQWMRRCQAKAMAAHGGLVLATLHLGSWDGCLIGGKRVFGRVVAYAKHQHNAAVDAALNRCREVTGAEILLARHADRTAAVTALRAVRAGASVGLLADQKPRSEEGAPARFLGLPVFVHPGPAFFVRKGPALVVPAFALRVRSGLTRVYVLRDEDLAGLAMPAATQRVMDLLSALIAAHPDQYFWHHRRFHDVPPDLLPTDHGQWRQGIDFVADRR